MARSIDAEERRARLADRHRLAPERRTDDVVAIADSVVALHSTDPATVYLAAMARMEHPSREAVAQALFVDRALIRHHAMRRTLWVAPPETVRDMHAAATRKLVATERRRTVQLLADSGVSEPEAWLDDARAQVIADLRAHGPSTARELGRRVAALRQPLQLSPGKAYAATQSAHTRVLQLLGFEGVVLRAESSGWLNGAYRYAEADSWLPGGLGDRPERPAAARLAAAYLRRFGPVTTADLQWWAGWTLTVTRQALTDAEAVEVRLTDGPGWLAADDEPFADPGPWVAVLPGLDPTTMGWKHRGWYLPEGAAEAFDNVGNGGPTIWVDGRVVGVWARTPDGTWLTHWFERVTAARRREVDERLAELARAIGGGTFTIRFPSPVHDRLLGRPVARRGW